VLQAERSWGALARLAYFYGKRGDVAGADHLYEEAEDQLTAKEMRSYAWLEVQRGFLAFAHGRYGEARLHYGQADAAYPGYWLVAEHIAELMAAKGQYSQAVEILQSINSTADRPELQQAIGELYEIAGEAARARDWHRSALTGYLQSAQRGEVHYYHHLADYSCAITFRRRRLLPGRIAATASRTKPATGSIGHSRRVQSTHTSFPEPRRSTPAQEISKPAGPIWNGRHASIPQSINSTCIIKRPIPGKVVRINVSSSPAIERVKKSKSGCTSVVCSKSSGSSPGTAPL
jgi:hypothetical protein